MGEPQDLTKDGDPSGTTPGDPAQVMIAETEWVEMRENLAKLTGKVEAYETQELRLGQQNPEIQTPAEPVKPPDPEFQFHSEEDLKKAIDEGDFTSYHRMMSHNQETHRKKDRWEIQTQEIEPLKQTGAAAISDLSGAVAQPQMPHLDVPEVKAVYLQRLQGLKATGQAVTAEVHKSVYDWAVGENITKVQDKFQQGFLREQADIQANTPTDTTGRGGAGNDAVTIPSIMEFFEPVAITKLQQKYPGMSPEAAADREFARHGGFEGYYKKFFGPQKGEEK